MKNTEWTTLEEQALISMRHSGMNDADIAVMLDRTPSAVENRRSKLAARGIDGMVKWKCGETKTYRIDKPDSHFYEENIPVLEMDQPELELTDSDLLLAEVREVIAEELTYTNTLMRGEFDNIFMALEQHSKSKCDDMAAIKGLVMAATFFVGCTFGVVAWAILS